MTEPKADEHLEATLVAAATEDCWNEELKAKRLAEIESPRWGPSSIPNRHDDWTDFVPDVVADVWEQLPFSTKLALFLVAKPYADVAGWRERD